MSTCSQTCGGKQNDNVAMLILASARHVGGLHQPPPSPLTRAHPASVIVYLQSAITQSTHAPQPSAHHNPLAMGSMYPAVDVLDHEPSQSPWSSNPDGEAHPLQRIWRGHMHLLCVHVP